MKSRKHSKCILELNPELQHNENDKSAKSDPSLTRTGVASHRPSNDKDASSNRCTNTEEYKVKETEAADKAIAGMSTYRRGWRRRRKSLGPESRRPEMRRTRGRRRSGVLVASHDWSIVSETRIRRNRWVWLYIYYIVSGNFSSQENNNMCNINKTS